MIRSILIGAFSLLTITATGCQNELKVAQAAEATRSKLQNVGVESIRLTPTVEEAGQVLFQVEGRRGENKVMGAAEVRYQEKETPGVRLDLFEVSEVLEN